MSPGRGELAEALRRSARQSTAADTLWACGRRAEALRLVSSAFGHALEALGSVEVDLGDKHARRIERAADALKLPLPLLEEELDEVHTQLFESWRRACLVIERALLEQSVDTETATRERRIGLGVAVVFVALVAFLVAWTWAFVPEDIEVRASGYRVLETVETWPPQNVIDRDEMTYWHLPPGETGYVELRFPSRRYVRALRILNAHDLHADDENRKDRRHYQHASQNIFIRAFDGERMVAETEATLPQVRDFERTTVELGASGVDRIRIEVLTFYGLGGGLAEIEVLE